MILFLTSDIGARKKENGIRGVSELNNINNFVGELQKYITKGKNFLFIASSPENFEINDFYGQLTFNSFNISGFEFKNLQILDYRNLQNAENLIKEASIIFLAGGNTIREMQFFNELNLSSLLKKYGPIIIGQSAGALNLAHEVYCSPEDENEIENIRYFSGLGLTYINIEPHFKNSPHFGEWSVLERILLEDSKKKPFIAITDGSFIVDNGIEQTIFGEAYEFSKGDYKQICENGKKISLHQLSFFKNQQNIEK